MQRKYKYWKKSERDYLVKNYSTMGRAAVAEALGRSWSSVSNEAKKLGLRVSRKETAWTDDAKRKARAMLAHGLTAASVAEACGRTISSIYNAIRRFGLAPEGLHAWKKWTDEEVETLRALKKNGKTAAEIAAILGRSSKSVANYATRHCIRKGYKDAGYSRFAR